MCIYNIHIQCYRCFHTCNGIAHHVVPVGLAAEYIAIRTYVYDCLYRTASPSQRRTRPTRPSCCTGGRRPAAGGPVSVNSGLEI